MPDWRYDFMDPENEKFFSNPRTEMAPEDYAPMRDRFDEFDYGDLYEEKEPNPYDGDLDDDFQ
jgi:hypothetical protein